MWGKTKLDGDVFFGRSVICLKTLRKAFWIEGAQNSGVYKKGIPRGFIGFRKERKEPVNVFWGKGGTGGSFFQRKSSFKRGG